MKIEIAKNNKEFKILDNDKIILKGHKPKWYSPEIQFFYNSKTYELKKKNFWATSFIILESGQPIGDINWSFKTDSKIILKDKQYWLKTEKVGKWYASDRQYILCENGKTPVLTIHYVLKKWKESLEAEFKDKDHADYVLLACALFVMKQQQRAQNSAAAGGFGA